MDRAIFGIKILKYTLLILLLSQVSLAQDSTRSEAFKPKPFQRKKHPVIKRYYSTFPLISSLRLIEKANDGDPIAQHELGLRYLLGVGYSKDTTKAVYWIEKAVEKNLTAACFNYAIMIINENGVKWDPFKASKYIEFAAKNGMPVAQFAYGLAFTENLIMNRNLDSAYKWLSLAKVNGYEDADKVINEMIKKGYTPPKTNADNYLYSSELSGRVYKDNSDLLVKEWELDYIEFEEEDESKTESEKIEALVGSSKKSIKKALGIDTIPDTLFVDSTFENYLSYGLGIATPEAYLTSAKLYKYGIKRPKNNILAAQNYLRAYKSGSLKAIEFLIELSKDERFFKKLKNEIDRNNPNAMYVWAGLTALGLDFQLTSEQAFELLNRAANLNHSPSIIEIALCYINGTFVDKDSKKAKEYLKVGIDQNNKEAQVRLSVFEILNEENVTKNIKLLKISAKEGSVLAQTFLGFCFENGIGVARSNSKAEKLYRKASNKGSETAYKSLQKMYNKIRPNEKKYQIVQ